MTDFEWPVFYAALDVSLSSRHCGLKGGQQSPPMSIELERRIVHLPKLPNAGIEDVSLEFALRRQF